jgi:hypothetical protein
MVPASTGGDWGVCRDRDLLLGKSGPTLLPSGLEVPHKVVNTINGAADQGSPVFMLPAARAAATGLPAAAQLEVRIGVFVLMPGRVIVRSVDVHPGRPFRRLRILAGARSRLGERRRREDGAESDDDEKLLHRIFHDGSPEFAAPVVPGGARIMLPFEDALVFRPDL